jgi:cytoskeletal protein CcmA (bactofilin family)
MSMFGDKTEDNKKPAKAAPAAAEPAPAAAGAAAVPLPLKQGTPAPAAPAMPARKQMVRPEIVRRTRDYTSGVGRDDHGMGGGFNDSKKLIVGRDIALSGEINACEKLVVQGRVEANMTDCSEIEVTETGTFKGEAEVDVAEIDGVFEGSLIARELLLIRANGHVTGTIRFGRLEVERGGELMGDVQVYKPVDGED